jgi:malate synthase
MNIKEGRKVEQDWVRTIVDEELERIRRALGDEAYASSRFGEARSIFEEVTLKQEFTEFLTIPAYEYI